MIRKIIKIDENMIEDVWNLCKKNVVYYEEYSDINQAIDREKKLKKWRREKKDWLIRTVNPELKDLFEDFSIRFAQSK